MRWTLVALSLALAACTSEVLEPIAGPDAGIDIATPPCSELGTGRIGATLTYLPAIDRVLVVGGYELEDRVIQYVRTIELYDPRTGEWSDAGELRSGEARRQHTATLLDDGRVLVAGGEAHVALQLEALKSAFIVDARNPNQVIITPGLIMNEARTGHIAERLPDGRVLLAGGRQRNPASTAPRDQTYLSSIELFDPLTSTFVQAGDMTVARYGHTSAVFGSKVVIAGGGGSLHAETGVEVLDTTASPIAAHSTGGGIATGPVFTRAAVLSDQLVAFSGGYPRIDDAERFEDEHQPPTSFFEVWTFNATTEQLLCGADTHDARGFHTMTALGGGNVLLAGGVDAEGNARKDAILLENTFACGSLTPKRIELCDARAEHAAVRLGTSGSVLIAGGRHETARDAFGTSSTRSEVR